MRTTIMGDSGLEYRWNGSHTVNIYQDGQEVDVFTSGEDEPSYADILDSIERREACMAGNHPALPNDPMPDGYCHYCGEELEQN